MANIPHDQDLMEAIEKADNEKAEKIIEANMEILMAEMKEFQNKKWENNYLCNCGASNPQNCDCNLSNKQLRNWKKRTNRKTSEKYGDKAMTLMLQKSSSRNLDGLM